MISDIRRLPYLSRLSTGIASALHSSSVAILLRPPLFTGNASSVARMMPSHGSISRRASWCSAATGHSSSFNRILSPAASRTDASAHSWSLFATIHATSNVPTDIGQKRLAPVGSVRYAVEFVVPIMMKCLGRSTGKCAYAMRAGPSTWRESIALRCSISVLRLPARSDASTIHLPSVASINCWLLRFSGRSSENHAGFGHSACAALDFSPPCVLSQTIISSYLLPGCWMRRTAAMSMMLLTARTYGESSTSAASISHPSMRGVRSHSNLCK